MTTAQIEATGTRTERARLQVALQSPALRVVMMTLVFVALTVVMTWPMARYAGSAVQDLGDPLYEIWTMRWVQHQIATDPAHLWDGNTGYPFPHSLLFSEPRLSTGLIAWPIQWAGDNDVLTYNLMFLLSFVLVGLGMALLVREMTGSDGAGLLAGVVAAFAPYRYGHLSHLNLDSYGWLPLALWALLRFACRRRARDAALAGVLLTIQVLASDTLALMAACLATATVLWLLWQERRQLSLGLLAGMLLALGLPAAALVPVVEAHQSVNQMYGFTRDLATVHAMSATPESYLSVSPGNHVWSGTLPLAYPNPLFPGAVALSGAAFGLTIGVRRWPRWVLLGALLALGGVVLSLGPETTAGGRVITLPYGWVYDHVPVMRSLRDVARFGMVALFGVQLLAGLGFAATWSAIRSRLSPKRARLIGVLALALLLVVASAELRTGASAVEVPRDEATTAVYDWLAHQPAGPVIEFPANGLWRNVGWSTEQIYQSTHHWHPIVAAYTSFLPERHVALLVALHGGTTAASAPTPRNVGILQDLGIRYVVVHRIDGYDWQAALAAADRLPELTRVGEYGAAVVYTLTPGNRRPVRYQLAAPSSAQAGQEIIATWFTRNDNANPALTTIMRPSEVVAEWLTRDGQVASEERLTPDLPLAVDPGLKSWPLRLRAPAAPGHYRLRLSLGALAEPIEQSIEVKPVEALDANAAITLQRIDWPRRDYRPGDRLDALLEWEVNRQPARSLTVTVQLLDANNRPVAQADGLPFDGRALTTDWRAGTVIAQPVSLRLPDNVRPGDYRLMVALYDESRPNLPRVPLELSGGAIVPEAIVGPVMLTASEP